MERVFTLLLLPVFVLGAVYEISEPDLLEEIESQKQEAFVKIRAYINRQKKIIENFEGEKLTPAKKYSVYEIDPTYCLEENIYTLENNKWKVLYPKGFCFNPVLYLPKPPPIVVFNACKKEELLTLKKILKNLKNYILVSSGCPLREIKKLKFEKPVYLLTKELLESFRLKHTLSVISVDKQKGVIRVEEIPASSSS